MAFIHAINVVLDIYVIWIWIRMGHLHCCHILDAYQANLYVKIKPHVHKESKLWRNYTKARSVCCLHSWLHCPVNNVTTVSLNEHGWIQWSQLVGSFSSQCSNWASQFSPDTPCQPRLRIRITAAFDKLVRCQSGERERERKSWSCIRLPLLLTSKHLFIS